MNNNRGSNRRRGRGNNRQQGGQQLNRIDSRARGNAPQLLEKYRKLAHYAHLNGDRVQEEYFLQFADHYFRVLADQRQRQDEQRQQRRDERQPDDDDRDYGDAGSDEAIGDDDRYNAPRAERDNRQRRDFRRDEAVAENESESGGDGEEARNPYEPAENPFTRDNRNVRGLKPRRGRRSREEGEGSGDGDAGEDAPQGLDPSALPPSISREETVGEDAVEAAPKPKRRAPRRKTTPDDGADETVSVAG